MDIDIETFNRIKFLLEKIKYRVADEDYNREVRAADYPFYAFSTENIILYDLIENASTEIIGSIEKENRDYRRNQFCNDNYKFLKEYFDEIDNLFKEIQKIILIGDLNER